MVRAFGAHGQQVTYQTNKAANWGGLIPVACGAFCMTARAQAGLFVQPSRATVGRPLEARSPQGGRWPCRPSLRIVPPVPACQTSAFGVNAHCRTGVPWTPLT